MFRRSVDYKPSVAKGCSGLLTPISWIMETVVLCAQFEREFQMFVHYYWASLPDNGYAPETNSSWGLFLDRHPTSLIPPPGREGGYPMPFGSGVVEMKDEGKAV
jgi:hypothetical protein